MAIRNNTPGPGTPTIEWWIGVVEDIHDPLKLGRCRIRIFGYHSTSKTELPTEHLPWAHPMLPVTSASMNGIGVSPTGVVQGSHVIGLFRDGAWCQEPVFGWTIGGIPRNPPDPSKGLNDPDGVYPKADFLNEPDTSRLARNEGITGTNVQTKKDSRKKEIPLANSDETWDEPETPYATEYPHNKVFETTSGHSVEFDDTPDAERISIYHKSGSFLEFHPSGTVVDKKEKDGVEVVAGDKLSVADGKLAITVGKNAQVLVNDNIDIESKSGDITITVKSGNVNLRVEQGNVDSEITGNVEQYITGNVKEKIAGSKKETISGSYILDCSGSVTIRGASINLN